MPLKDKNEYNNYMKQYRRNKKYNLDYQMKYSKVIHEFKQRAILPRHIYEFRKVIKQMLLVHFKKKIIKKYDRTELITQSWLNI